MCSLLGKSLAVFQKSCLSIHGFLVKNATICFFEEKMVLIENFYQIKVMLVKDWSCRLQKHQTLETLTKVDFYTDFKISTFFEILVGF